MRVRDLMTLLGEMNPDAEVKLMVQPSWPFECSLKGVAVRHQFQEEGEVSNGEPDDVFLLQGNQLGYGNPEAWDHPEDFFSRA